jgi:hypothetical protein
MSNHRQADETPEADLSPREMQRMAAYLRGRAREISRGTDLNEFNREARAVVLREEADLLERFAGL